MSGISSNFSPAVYTMERDMDDIKIIEGYARDVFLQVRKLVCEGYVQFAQHGYCRIGCDEVDRVKVFLIRPSKPQGRSLLPAEDQEFFSREG